MAFQNNQEKIKTPAALSGRDISARRAATIANMLDEAKARGFDDEFARAAIGKYGADNAKRMRAEMDSPDDFVEFAVKFGTGYGQEIYEMETVEHTKDKLSIDFHYCPYVAEWLKQGRSPEEIARLCDITMEGDREFAKQFPGLEFALQGTIAEGEPVCRLRFSRKN